MDESVIERPRLRPVEAFRIPDAPASLEGADIAVRDRSGLSGAVITLSEPALHLMALMDGSHTVDEIRREFALTFGQALAPGTVERMIAQLDSVHFLDSPAFESFYLERQEAYRRRGVREGHDGRSLGLGGEAGVAAVMFDEMLAEASPPTVPGSVVGLVAPHLDYGRGRRCYAAAYGAVRNRPAPDRVVILGTNHFGCSSSVVATACDFVTPLGRTGVDVAFLERLEARCGSLRAHELDHLHEHSVELQVMWLQHVFQAETFSIVPFLCPDPCGPTGTRPRDERGVDLGRFARALGELIDEDDRDTLVVAGADLSHVGAAFGDDRALDAAYLEEVRARDRRVLERIEINDPDGFVACVAEGDNPTNVCSAGCIFALATALPHTTGTILQYHQAVDPSTQTCVTCAAAAFV